MIIEIGIIFAFLAMLCWGFGDFMMQKSARKIGDLETVFIITFLGAVILLPFVYKDIGLIFSFSKKEILYLIIGGVAYFAAGLLDLEALKRGKLAVVEPIWSLEIPVSGLLAFFILSESIGFVKILLIFFLIVGLVLVSLKKHHLKKESWFEKGVLIALFAAGTMGIANFLIGAVSRFSDALLARWMFCVMLAIFSFASILIFNRAKKLKNDFLNNKKFSIGMAIIDNAAWTFFGFALVLAPIAIAVALSESYIIIAVLLGMFVNREKITHYQVIGLIIALVSAIALAVMTA